MNKKVQLGIALAFLIVGIVSAVNTIRLHTYIRDTLKRDDAQEQCITEQAEWLQGWLHWRWIDHVEATNDQIIEYHRVNPQPACKIGKR